jgi:hypothetical protein
MLFAIALAARTWVKLQEPTTQAIRRRDETLEAWNALKSGVTPPSSPPTPEDVIAAGAQVTDRSS